MIDFENSALDGQRMRCGMGDQEQMMIVLSCAPGRAEHVLQNTRFPSTNNRNTTMASCTGRLQSGSSTYDNAPGEQHETGRTA